MYGICIYPIIALKVLHFFFFQLCKPLYRGAAWMSFTGITIAEGEPQLILA